MANFCMNCGTKLNEEDAFCHNCGSPTDVSQGGKDNISNNDKTQGKPEGALFYVNGIDAELSIFEEYIELDFTGNSLKRLMSRYGGVKRIYYPHIMSIQKRDPTNTNDNSSKKDLPLRGSIEFEVPGMVVSQGKGKKENIVHYDPPYQNEADKIFEYVHQKLLTINNQKTDNVSTQIKEAKELLDIGVLSQEEFDAIKGYYLARIKSSA